MVYHVPYELISHMRKICSLYKRWLRNLEAHNPERHEYRFNAVLARRIFEDIMNEKDMVRAKQMIEDREEELFHDLHNFVRAFPTSPGGVAYDRYLDLPDSIVDYWHPLEKAAYPKYFQKRELRKQQYIEMWERQYGRCKEESKEEQK